MSAGERLGGGCPGSDLGARPTPRPELWVRDADRRCCLFPVLDSKAQAARPPPFLLSTAIDFSLPSFILFVASLAPHNCIISAEARGTRRPAVHVSRRASSVPTGPRCSVAGTSLPLGAKMALSGRFQGLCFDCEEAAICQVSVWVAGLPE